MNGRRKPRCHSVAVLGYVPAEAHFTRKNSWVDLYAFDPVTGKLRCKRYKLNRIKSRNEKRAYARQLCLRLNEELSKGWNPWVVPLDPQAEKTLAEACEEYLRLKLRTTTNRSPASYQSHVRMLLAWCGKHRMGNITVSAFAKKHALQYMDYIRDERKVNNTTYNNYHLFASGIFNWFIERGYITVNPFSAIKRLRKTQKLRTLISKEDLKQCLKWFEENNPPMVYVCLFVFHTLLRPRSELMRIKVKDVDLENGVINVDGSMSKSKRVRRPAIPPFMVDYLKRSPLMQADPDDYVVGKGLRPGPIESGYNYMGLCWNAMRKALGWGSDKQLYSLRDSGIIQLIRDGVDLHVVMRQADHATIETTNRYIQHYFPNSAQQIHQKATSMM